MKLPLSTRIARRTLRALPAPRFPVAYEPDLRVPMPDGVDLLADHYFPDPATPQDFPTLLMRSPHGRGLRWSASYGVAFAEQGFHVLLQSARGTGGSGGFFQPWRDDGPDGHATIAWLRRQPWFDGRLGLIGPGAIAYAHWALAADPPPELKAMVMQMPLHSPHAFFHRSGVFALEDALAFAATLATDRRTPRRFLSAATHPDPADGYWQGTDLLTAADGLTVPTLVTSGWSDVALDQALQQYGRLPAEHRALLIGPWTHTAPLRHSAGAIFAESLAWLRGHLVGPSPPKAYVRVAVGSGDGGNGNEWRDLPTWPPVAVPMSWYLSPDGALAREPPRPSVASGAVHYTALEHHDDVLVFTSPPLTDAIEVIGAVAAEIVLDPSSQAASTTTLFVRLCDVDEKGRSWNICDDITRVPDTRPATVTIAMSSTAHRFDPGHRIRLQITSGAHPRFAAGRDAFHLDIRPGSAIVLPAA